MILMGHVSAYLSQSVYFNRSVQEKTQVKIKLYQFLMQGKRNEVWWDNFPKANEA
jgi:hypothetical protein